jgi:cyclophilin family peptidyl-prolyl cis-trans isomerase
MAKSLWLLGQPAQPLRRLRLDRLRLTASRRRRLRLEPLEPRLTLDGSGPSFSIIGNQTVLGGAPLWLGIDGGDFSGSGPLTYSVSVSNPSLLQAIIPTGNKSLQLNVSSTLPGVSGHMTYELFDNLVPHTTQHIETLVNQGDFNSSANLAVDWYRISHYGDDTPFVIQGGPQYPLGVSSLGQFDDEFSPDLQFTSAGLLAMAKSSDDTNDAQIFVTGSPSRFLDFQHSIFGVLTEGELVREAIQESRPTGDGQPPAAIVFDSSTIITDTQNAALELKAAVGASGSSDVTLTVTNAQNSHFSQSFHVTVAPDPNNPAPFLNPIGPIVGFENQPITLQLTATDVQQRDADFFDAQKPPGETAADLLSVDHSTGQVIITPPTDFVGTFKVQMAVRAANNARTTSDQFDVETVTVQIIPPNGIFAANDTFSADKGTPLVVGPTSLLANDTTTGSAISVAHYGVAGHGIVKVNSDGGFTYTPNPGFAGLDSFTYQDTDADNNVSNTATIVVRVTANINAANDSYSTEAGTPLFVQATAGLLANDNGGADVPLGAVLVAGVPLSLGSVTLHSDGSFQYFPTPGFSGSTSFTYYATDGARISSVATVTITVQREPGPLVDFGLAVTAPDGSPLTSLAAGQNFVLRVSVKDDRPVPRGVFAAYLDVAWDATKAVVTGPLQFNGSYRSFESGDTSTPGVIDGGGATGSIVELGGGQREVFSLPMRATAAGRLVFTADPADNSDFHDVLIYGSDDPVPDADVTYGTTAVTVAAPPPSVNFTLQITTPGGPPVVGLAPGQDFVLHVLTQDASVTPHGVFAAYLDVTWDATKAIITGPLQFNGPYQSFRSSDTSTPGAIDEGGAIGGIVELGGGQLEVFSVPMRATAAGTLNFTANSADDLAFHQVLVYGSNDPVPDGDVTYGTASVPVFAPPPPLPTPGARLDHGLLWITGTQQRDVINVNVAHHRLIVSGTLGGARFSQAFMTSSVHGIIGVLAGGNDAMALQGAVPIPLFVDGGTGDDTIEAGAGPALLVGGEGNDVLRGGNRRDVLIGGDGRDQLFGNGGSDLLIGGRTAYDKSLLAMIAIQLEWNGPITFASRLANLQNGAGPFVQPLGISLVQDQTVLEDGSADVLFGGSDVNWLFDAPVKAATHIRR